MTFRIESLTAFTQIGDDDEEGIIALLGPEGIWLPMIAADHERVASLRAHAEATAKITGRPVRLVRFTVGTVIEEIKP